MIKSSLIVLDSPLETMESVVYMMIDEAFTQGLITDKESFYQSVKKREELASTAIGYGIAIPHGKNSTVKEPFVAFLRTQKPFSWSSSSDEEVRSVFMMGLPESNSDHLHLRFLAEISKKLMDDGFRDSLTNCKTAEEAFSLLNEVNIRIGGEV